MFPSVSHSAWLPWHEGRGSDDGRGSVLSSFFLPHLFSSPLTPFCLPLSRSLAPSFPFFSLYCTLFPVSRSFFSLSSYSFHALPQEMMNNSKRWDEEKKMLGCGWTVRIQRVITQSPVPFLILSLPPLTFVFCLDVFKIDLLSVSVLIPFLPIFMDRLLPPPPTSPFLSSTVRLQHRVWLGVCVNSCVKLGRLSSSPGLTTTLRAAPLNSVLACWPVCPPLLVQCKLVHALPWQFAQPPDGRGCWLWRILSKMLSFLFSCLRHRDKQWQPWKYRSNIFNVVTNFRDICKFLKNQRNLLRKNTLRLRLH